MGVPYFEYGTLGHGIARSGMAKCQEAWCPNLLACSAVSSDSVPPDILVKSSRTQVIIFSSDDNMLWAVELYR